MIDISKVSVIANEEANSIGLSIESVEWVVESGYRILRIIADKVDGLDINDATKLNELISNRLDEINLIDEEYMLEVSSPGAERELKNDDDIIKNVGSYLHVDFKNKVMITKESYIDNCDGTLSDIVINNRNLDKIVIKINIKGRIKTLEIEKSNIKFIRKAIKF